VLLTTAIWLFTAEPKRGAQDKLAFTTERGTLAGLIKNPGFWTGTLGMAMMTFAIGGISVWMPTFLSRERNMTLAYANYIFGIVTVVTGLLGTLIGGWIAQRMLKTNHAAFYFISAISMALALPAAIYAVFGPQKHLIPAIAITEFFLFVNTGPLNAAIVNSISSEIRARALALNLLVIHLLGDAGSPTLMGWISDHSSLARSFIAAFVAMLFSAIILFYGMRFAPKLEPGTEAQPA
jgi:sugar phosphate permease